MDSQQRPSVQQRELCSVLYGSLDGRGVSGRWIHMCVRLSPFAVHLKLSQHCWSAIGQYKIKSFFKKYELEEQSLVRGISVSENHTCAYLLAQPCPALCDPMDSSLPGSSVHGILRATVLEWVAMPFSRGSSQTRDWTPVTCLVDWFFTFWATREAQDS